jgi:hypothetical protein
MTIGDHLPVCSVCKRQVDRLDRIDDVATATVVLVAHCHGMSERVECPVEVLEAAEKVQLGMAFEPGDRKSLATWKG